MLICDNALYSFDTPVVIHNVEDDGEQTSDKEAEFITDTIDKLISKGVTASEIGVLAPFRAQAANVRRHIRKCKTIPDDVKNEITADTIDKMQGQEREVIIFSMVSGNLDYMTEMAEFLYSPNKLNVAFSRAKSKLIVVGNINRIKQLNMAEYPHIEKMLNTKYATML
jgi:superfamily I DNA and/or RNA helicase